LFLRRKLGGKSSEPKTMSPKSYFLGLTTRNRGLALGVFGLV
jgi:hypothetical protein